MLKIACLFDKVFKKFEECDHAYRTDLGDDVPDFMDWLSVKQLVDFLEKFYLMTLRISGSHYVTANTFFYEIADLFCILKEWQSCDDVSKRSMAFSMKTKFDKYWGDPTKMNLLIFIEKMFLIRDVS